VCGSMGVWECSLSKSLSQSLSTQQSPVRNRYGGKGAQALRAAGQPVVAGLVLRCGWRGAIPCSRTRVRRARPPRNAGKVCSGAVRRWRGGQGTGRPSTFATRPAGNGRRAFIVILNRNSRLQSPRHRCRSRRAQSGVGRRRPGVPSRLYGARWGASEDGIPLPGRHVIIECLEFGRKTLERKR